jgi:transcriptional regulator with XRE-family HTH domain
MKDPESKRDSLLQFTARAAEESSRVKYPEFAQLMRDAMDEQQIATYAVASTLKVSTQMVGKYMRGESLPSIDKIPALANLLGVSMDELLVGTPISPTDVIRRRGPRQSIVEAIGLGESGEAPQVRRASMPNNVRFVSRTEMIGPKAREVVYYRIREKLDYYPVRSLPSDSALRPPVPTRMVTRPIDEGKLFDLRPDMALIGRDGWKLAVEVKVGRPPLANLAGLAYNWRLSTEVPLFLVIVRDPKNRNRQPTPPWAEDDDSLEDIFPQEPTTPAFLDRYTRSLQAMVEDGLFRHVSVVNYDDAGHRISDYYPDAYKFGDMLDKIAGVAAEPN